MRFLTTIIKDARFRVSLLYWLTLLALFSLERILILTTLRDQFADVAWADLLRCLLVGIRFDICISSLLTALLFFLLLPASIGMLRRRGYRALLLTYVAVTLSLVFLLCTSDYIFFDEFSERLDHKAVHYMQFSSTYRLLLEDTPIVPALVVAAILIPALLWVVRRVCSLQEHRSGLFGTLTWLLLVPVLLVLGIRGTVGPKAINSGIAYFSPSTELAQGSLNGVFSLIESVDATYLKHTPLREYVKTTMTPEEALRVATDLLSGPGQEFLGDPENPLRRITTSAEPLRNSNVVIVLMESLSAHFIGAMGSELDVTPNLDALVEQGILFDHCFAVGSRTMNGISGVLCGFPDVPGSSVVSRSDAEGSFFTIARVLQERGYESLFCYGGQPNYDHMQSFLRSNGFDGMVFEDDFESRTFRNSLGWCDEDLFKETDRRLRLLGARPFIAVLLTLSFHRPYTFPEGRVEQIEGEDGDRLSAVLYADWAIGEFLRIARTAPYYDDTIFVFVADHSGTGRGRLLSPVPYRVPFLIHAPGLVGREPRRVSTVCSQTDIAPTIMEILGGAYENTFLGSSVLSRPHEQGRALMLRGDKGLAYIEAGGECLTVSFHGEKERLRRFVAPDRLTRIPRHDANRKPMRDRLFHRAIALTMSAETLYRRGAYNLAAKEQ